MLAGKVEAGAKIRNPAQAPLFYLRAFAQLSA
jgi:hypothetical protein